MEHRDYRDAALSGQIANVPPVALGLFHRRAGDPAFALVLEPSGGIGPASWPFMLYIGLIVAPIGTWCVVEVGRRLPGAVASVAFLLVPAFGVFVSTLWLGEAFGWDMMVGSGLIVGSVILAAAE